MMRIIVISIGTYIIFSQGRFTEVGKDSFIFGIIFNIYVFVFAK